LKRLFYYRDLPSEGEEFELSDAEEVRHISVMRFNAGDMADFTDGKGRRVSCRMIAADKNGVRAVAVAEKHVPHYPVSLTLAFAITKRSKWEWLIEKGTELGVTRFVPLVTERNRDFTKGAHKKSARFVKVAAAAMKQSKRLYLPEITEPVEIKKLFTEGRPADRILLLAFGGGDAATNISGSYCDVTVLVGPEGGLTSDEESFLVRKGALPTSLGEYTLKTETAAIKMISLVTSRFGDF